MPKEGRTHYVCWYRLDSTDAYLIWYSNDDDGVIVDSSKDVLVFTAPEDASTYAKANGILIKKEAPELHDLDIVDRWSNGQADETPRPDEILAAWNLLSDISSSVGEEFEKGEAGSGQIYEKLFLGNNLPSITPPGEQYTPVWEEDELQLMRNTLKKGLEVFRSHVKVTRP